MDPKAAVAELIGTFTLVLIGAGAGALAESSGGGIVGVSFAHGPAQCYDSDYYEPGSVSDSTQMGNVGY